MNLCGLSPTRFRGVRHKPLGQPSLGVLTVSQVEPLFNSVIRTYYKLDELGIKEVDGQIVFIDNMEVSHE
mgnify:CR=1 FL=1